MNCSTKSSTPNTRPYARPPSHPLAQSHTHKHTHTPLSTNQSRPAHMHSKRLCLVPQSGVQLTLTPFLATSRPTPTQTLPRPTPNLTLTHSLAPVPQPGVETRPHGAAPPHDVTRVARDDAARAEPTPARHDATVPWRRQRAALNPCNRAIDQYAPEVEQ